MKVGKGIVLGLIILGFTLCILGISISSHTVNASNNIYDMKFNRIKSLYVPASYVVDYNSAANSGKSTYDKYNTVQSFVHTKDKYAFMLTNTGRDEEYKKETNLLYIMCKKNNKWEHCKSIRKLTYGHGNDMAYNPNDNTVAVLYRDPTSNTGKVAFLDGDTFNEKKKIDVKYKYGAIAYDKSLKKYYLSRYSSADESFHYTVCDDIISDKTCKKDVFSSKRRMTGQGMGAANGYVYKINFDAGHATKYQTSSYLNYYGGEIDVFKYDKAKDKYSHVRSIYFRSAQQGIPNIGEIEGIDFSGDTPYLLFNGNTIKDNNLDGHSTMGRVYTPVYIPRNVNAKIYTKVKTNNKNAFEKLKLKANFSSSSPKINKNVTSTDNGYTLSNIAISSPGTYTVKVKQNNISNSNWNIDKSTKTATIKVSYCLAINNLIYSTSFSKGDNTFNNTFSYTPIEVPVSVSVKTTKKDESYKVPNTKATLYKDGKKIETVTASKEKYTFKKLKFTKKGTYKYEIKQENSGTIKDGIYTNTIDSSTISLTITVSENETTLTQKSKYNKTSFTNKVDAHFDDVSNKIILKIKTNKSDTAVPTPKTSATLTKNNKTISTVNSEHDKYTFDIKVNSPGAHKYSIKQNTGTSGQGIYSYILDKSIINLTINAKINGNKLECTPKISGNTFINKINANYDEISVPINTKIITEKEVTALPIPNTKAVITNGEKTETITNEGESYNYTAKIKKPGTYTYKIKQKGLSNTSDYIYNIDTKTITYTVVVTSSPSGILDYNLIADSSGFSNSISENNNANLSLSVSIETERPNGVSIPTTQAILSKDGSEIKTVDSSNNKYTFTGVSITDAGTYTYKIKQKQNGTITDGIFVREYDESEIVVTIIARQEDDKLKASITYSKNSFKNKITCNYDEILVPIKINILNEKDDQSITINKTSASIYKDDIKISTKENENNLYSFNMKISTPGIYTYEIRQEAPGIHKTDTYNYNIDNDTKTCIITVTENNGVLTANTKFLYHDDTFENSYSKKYDSISVPLSINIDTTKKESTILPTTTAVLIDDNDEIEEVINKNNKYSFNSLEFISKGTFVYTIKQKNAGITTNGIYEYDLDDEEITVEIVITAENGKLKPTVNYEKNTFYNEVKVHYEPVLVPLEININTEKQNDLSSESSAIISNDERVLDQITAVESKYKSNKVYIDDEGVYKFKIRQKKPHNSKKSGVKRILDDKVITATVTATAQDGVLKYSVSYDNDTFNNKLESTTDADDIYATIPVNIDVYSNSSMVDNLNIAATMFEDNLPIETVSQENSTYSFENLQLLPGTYNYSIKQTKVNNPDWVTDDEQLDLTITVNEDLTYNVQFREDISSFTNIEINTVGQTKEDSTSSEIISGIPNTISNANIVLIIIGIISIITGVYIMYITSKKEKGISL